MPEPIARRHVILAGAAAVLASTTIARAQSNAVRLRGTIAGLRDRVLTLRARDGSVSQIKLAADLRVSQWVRTSRTNIKQGLYIGAAAEPAGDGAWRALEVHIFPDSMRGVAEGHREWDLTPTSTMTNATVDAVVDSADGSEVVLIYKGGSIKVSIGPDTPVFVVTEATPSVLQPGAELLLLAMRDADGSLSANRVTVTQAAS